MLCQVVEKVVQARSSLTEAQTAGFFLLGLGGLCVYAMFLMWLSAFFDSELVGLAGIILLLLLAGGSLVIWGG